MKHLFTYLFLLISSFSFASQALFTEANDLYNQEKYKEAIVKYESLINLDIVDESVYYNLANACYKEENFASAILNYERALRLNPSSEDIKYNLALANQHIIDQIEALPKFWLSDFYSSMVQSFHSDTWGLILNILLLAMLAALILFFIGNKSSMKKMAMTLSLVLFTLSILTYLFGNSQYQVDKTCNYAIVFEQNVYVKNAPSAQSSDAFILHEGTKVMILDNVNEWANIKLADGKKGWIEIAACKQI